MNTVTSSTGLTDFQALLNEASYLQELAMHRIVSKGLGVPTIKTVTGRVPGYPVEGTLNGMDLSWSANGEWVIGKSSPHDLVLEPVKASTHA